MKNLLVLGLLILGALPALAQQPDFDLLLRGGEIIDGSGKPRYRADVGIVGDEIVAVGRLPDAAAKRVVDVSGRVVTPGFIDLHAHVADEEYGDRGLLSPDVERGAAQNFVAQGVTTSRRSIDSTGAQSRPTVGWYCPKKPPVLASTRIPIAACSAATRDGWPTTAWSGRWTRWSTPCGRRAGCRRKS